MNKTLKFIKSEQRLSFRIQNDIYVNSDNSIEEGQNLVKREKLLLQPMKQKLLNGLNILLKLLIKILGQ